MKLITLLNNGTLSESMDLMKFSQVLTELSKKDPNASLDLRLSLVLLPKGFGPATIHFKNKTSKITELKNEEAFLISPQDSLKVEHKDFTATFFATNSGDLDHSIEISNQSITNLVEIPKDASIEVIQAMDWLKNGEVGASSKALVTNLILIPNNIAVEASTNTPMDNADFARCYKLIKKIPSILDNLEKMAQVSPEWERLVIGGKDSLFCKKMEFFESNPPSELPPPQKSTKISFS